MSKKSTLGFNIDLFGLSFGKNQSGKFNASGSELDQSMQAGKPTVFNALLVSDSDRGSLNSELYYAYTQKNKNKIRFGLSFQFTEYTINKKLTYDNDRFRHKTLMPFVGYTYNLKK